MSEQNNRNAPTSSSNGSSTRENDKQPAPPDDTCNSEARLLDYLKSGGWLSLAKLHREEGTGLRKPPASLEKVPTVGSDPANKRRWVRTELMGAHSHPTSCHTTVHVWKCAKSFIARGFYQGQRFAETLDSDWLQATTRLRQILNEIEEGSYVRPKDARRRLIARGKIPRLSLRQLIDEFLAEKRKTLGKQSSGNYRSRLLRVLDFAEQPANRQRWPLAMHIDRSFVVDLRSTLVQQKTTRNGRPGGKPKPMSARQVINVLETLRTALCWAVRADVRKLPVGWVNPLTTELIGTPPTKDPHRVDPLPLEGRIRLIQHMDAWQLCQMALSIVLPMRPDEAAGLLIADVDSDQGWLKFGANLPDINFTKERLAFKLPFPPEVRPLLSRCIGGRAEGPLLRSRKSFNCTHDADTPVANLAELLARFHLRLLQQPPGAVQADHDRKLLFRHVLRELGGVSENAMEKAFREVLAASGVPGSLTLYTLRSSVTTTMKQDAKLDLLELRYLTSHSTSDILHHYTPLDIKGAMGRYFAVIQPLLEAITAQAVRLGIS